MEDLTEIGTDRHILAALDRQPLLWSVGFTDVMGHRPSKIRHFYMCNGSEFELPRFNRKKVWTARKYWLGIVEKMRKSGRLLKIVADHCHTCCFQIPCTEEEIYYEDTTKRRRSYEQNVSVRLRRLSSKLDEKGTEEA